MGRKDKERTPRAPLPPNDARLPRADIRSVRGMAPLRAFRIVDLGGPWCWSVLGGAALRQALERMKGYESMAWAEIEGPSGSHFVDLPSLARSARDRLVEIGQDDGADSLFSLRITGRQRVWGIRHAHVLRILWWDPEHQVCPSHKKHT